jgi:hypothetical protein
MGASGVGIFQDDVACDARQDLYDLYRDGADVREATDTTLEQMEGELDDAEDGPVVILALAAAQWEAGRLDNRILKRAMKILETGVDFRWADSEHADERLAVLRELKKKLETPPPAPISIDDLEA